LASVVTDAAGAAKPTESTGLSGGLGEIAERAVRPGDDPARHAAFWELIAY
jgi:hypothetical protein